jgi:hypothetical protein
VEGLARFSNSQVLHPERDCVLEARLTHPWGDLLFGFDIGDHLAHHQIGGALVQEALLDPAAAPSPAAFPSGSSQARPSRRLRCVLVASRHFTS